MTDAATNAFFNAVIHYIPQNERTKIHPLLAGGISEPIFDDDNDADIMDSTLNSRDLIKKRLRQAGFGSAKAFWAQPRQTHSISLDLEKQKAELETDDEISGEKLKPKTIYF